MQIAKADPGHHQRLVSEKQSKLSRSKKWGGRRKHDGLGREIVPFSWSTWVCSAWKFLD